MHQNKIAIYTSDKQDKLLQYLKIKSKQYISLYDDIVSVPIYDIPRFHYVELNNKGYDIYIDNIGYIDRLINKNNKIIYYLSNNTNHNYSYNKVKILINSVDSILCENRNVSPDLLLKTYDYKKEIIYV
jgi:hypothetical protein